MCFSTATKHRYVATVMENKIWWCKIRDSFSEIPKNHNSYSRIRMLQVNCRMNSQNCLQLNWEFLGITECAFTLLIFVEDDELLLQWSQVVKAIQSSETELTISEINSLFTQRPNAGWIFVGIGPVNNMMLLLTTYLRILVSVQIK